MNVKTIASLLLFIFSLIGLGCAGSGATARGPEGNFALTQLGEQTFTNAPAAIRIAGSSISGQGPVNQWSAQLQNGNVSGIIATRRAGPPELMRLEAELFAALEGASLRSDRSNGIRFTKGNRTVAEFGPLHSQRPR